MLVELGLAQVEVGPVKVDMGPLQVEVGYVHMFKGLQCSQVLVGQG
jgi:hypothetical protein